MIGSDAYRRGLNKEQLQKALILINELKARGVELPPDLKVPDLRPELKWNLDANGYFVRNDGVVFKPRQVLEDFIRSNARFILLKAGRGGGKALWVDTPILTSNRGWTTMGDVRVGDYVFDEFGHSVLVKFTSEVMYGHPCYTVTFSDGTTITADAEHLWEVVYKVHGGMSSKVLPTSELSPILYGNQYKWGVSVCNPLIYPDATLPIHPYVFGAWLGDGSSRDSTITISPNDFEMVEIIRECGWELHNVTDEFTWSFSHKGLSNSGFRDIVVNLGVWRNKHIPEEFLRGSVSQRISLLQGLMDTDGTISKRGHCSFDNKNYELIIGVRELMASLGLKPSLHKYKITKFSKETWCYKLSFTPTDFSVFRLSRKANRQTFTPRRDVYRRSIINVEKTTSVPVRCIEVDSPTHLFLVTNSFIATHNTTAGAQKALLKVRQGESGAVMSPDFENFRTSTWPELQKWIPWDMVVPSHRYRANQAWEAIRPFTIVFMNGAKMYCKGLKDPESARGANLNWFWYDEGRRDPTGLGWKNAIAFLRVGHEPQAWCTTTMAGLEHWTNKFFQGEGTEETKALISELRKKGITQPLFANFKTSTKENEENLDPVFYASLVSTYPAGHLRTREIDGEAADEGGSLGDRRWFDGKGLDGYPDWAIKNVRFWDLAATEQKILRGKKLNDPDETVGSLVGFDMNKDITQARFCLQDQFGGWWEWSKIKEYIIEIAKRDGAHVEICFEQEPASGGKNQIAELRDFIKKELPEWKTSSLEAKKLGDRVLAANTWFAEAARGQWYYTKGLWNEKFFSQLDRFDGISHDDRITSVTGARHKIAPLQPKWSGGKFVSI